MEERSEPVEAGHHGEVREVLTEARQVVTAIEDFQDRSQEWRRLFSELLGTLLLVLMAAGGA
jgi:aquaporin Z